MAKITRYTGDLQAFASDSLGTERTIFGDVTQADDLDSNINTDFLRGWGIIGVNENPTKQDFNALGYTATQLLAYLHQIGVAEWVGPQEYQIGSLATRSGAIYRCLTADHVSATAPEADAVNWKYLLSADDVTYDNTTSGATATDVQGALDEVFSAVSSATETTAGIAEIATQAETDAGTDDARLVTPLKLQNAKMSGHVVQMVSTTEISFATTTSQIPLDGTIPQNTEGAEFMSLSITPRFSDSKLLIIVSCYIAQNTSFAVTGALFKDSEANAIFAQATQTPNINNAPTLLTMTAPVDAGSTTSRAYKFRAGPSGGSTLTFNGVASAGLYSVTPSATMIIMEIAA